MTADDFSDMLYCIYYTYETVLEDGRLPAQGKMLTDVYPHFYDRRSCHSFYGLENGSTVTTNSLEPEF